MQSLEEFIKDLRVQIDAINNYVDNLRQTGISSNLSRTHRGLLLGKAWLGKCLGELGVATPSKNDGKRESAEDIEPTAEKANQADIASVTYPVVWTDMNRVQQIDYLREKIQVLADQVKNISPATNTTREFAISRTNAWTYLCEARFNLGFALEAIRG